MSIKDVFDSLKSIDLTSLVPVLGIVLVIVVVGLVMYVIIRWSSDYGHNIADQRLLKERRDQLQRRNK